MWTPKESVHYNTNITPKYIITYDCNKFAFVAKTSIHHTNASERQIT